MNPRHEKARGDRLPPGALPAVGRTPALQLDPVDFAALDDVRRCRVCSCTDLDCRGCIERTGEPCSWVEELVENPAGPICSACIDPEEAPDA